MSLSDDAREGLTSIKDAAKEVRDRIWNVIRWHFAYAGKYTVSYDEPKGIEDRPLGLHIALFFLGVLPVTWLISLLVAPLLKHTLRGILTSFPQAWNKVAWLANDKHDIAETDLLKVQDTDDEVLTKKRKICQNIYGLLGMFIGGSIGLFCSLPVLTFRVLYNSFISFARTVASIWRLMFPTEFVYYHMVTLWYEKEEANSRSRHVWSDRSAAYETDGHASLCELSEKKVFRNVLKRHFFEKWELPAEATPEQIKKNKNLRITRSLLGLPGVGLGIVVGAILGLPVILYRVIWNTFENIVRSFRDMHNLVMPSGLSVDAAREASLFSPAFDFVQGAEIGRYLVEHPASRLASEKGITLPQLGMILNTKNEALQTLFDSKDFKKLHPLNIVPLAPLVPSTVDWLGDLTLQGELEELKAQIHRRKIFSRFLGLPGIILGAALELIVGGEISLLWRILWNTIVTAIRTALTLIQDAFSSPFEELALVTDLKASSEPALVTDSKASFEPEKDRDGFWGLRGEDDLTWGHRTAKEKQFARFGLGLPGLLIGGILAFPITFIVNSAKNFWYMLAGFLNATRENKNFETIMSESFKKRSLFSKLVGTPGLLLGAIIGAAIYSLKVFTYEVLPILLSVLLSPLTLFVKIIRKTVFGAPRFLENETDDNFGRLKQLTASLSSGGNFKAEEVNSGTTLHLVDKEKVTGRKYESWGDRILGFIRKTLLVNIRRPAEQVIRAYKAAMRGRFSTGQRKEKSLLVLQSVVQEEVPVSFATVASVKEGTEPNTESVLSASQPEDSTPSTYNRAWQILQKEHGSINEDKEKQEEYRYLLKLVDEYVSEGKEPEAFETNYGKQTKPGFSDFFRGKRDDADNRREAASSSAVSKTAAGGG